MNKDMPVFDIFFQSDQLLYFQFSYDDISGHTYTIWYWYGKDEQLRFDLVYIQATKPEEIIRLLSLIKEYIQHQEKNLVHLELLNSFYAALTNLSQRTIALKDIISQPRDIDDQ